MVLNKVQIYVLILIYIGKIIKLTYSGHVPWKKKTAH